MEFYQKLNIPNECKVEKTIFKKLFYENASLSPSDKTLFTDAIDKITWQYCLNQSKINIPAYKDSEREYLEIEVLEVKLLHEKNLHRIAEIIMRAIPYPMLLFFLLDNKFQVWTAHQRFNLADNSKITVEDFVLTNWIDETSDLLDNISMKNMRFSNFYYMYSDMVDAIRVFNAKLLLGETSEISGQEAKQLLEQVTSIDNKIALLRAHLKKETQFNRKVEVNIEIKMLEKRKLDIINMH